MYYIKIRILALSIKRAIVNNENKFLILSEWRLKWLIHHKVVSFSDEAIEYAKTNEFGFVASESGIDYYLSRLLPKK